MLKLRKILLCNYIYYFLLLITILIVFIRVNKNIYSSYTIKSQSFIGIITKIKIDGDLLSLTIKDKDKESIIANYYFNTLKEKKKYQKNFKLGDKYCIKGEFKTIKKTTTENIYSYQEYAKNKKIFYTIKVNSFIKLEDNHNILYRLKNNIYNYFDHYKNSKYLKLLLLGDKTYVDKEIISAFRNNGISHLFAISGMHIGLISSFILNILNKIKLADDKRYFITCLLILIYSSLTGFTPSVMRAFLFFLLFSINKIYYFHIDSAYIYIITLIITLLINPYYIYDIGFQYSFVISFILIISSKNINKYHNYFVKLFITSSLSFFASLPITLYHFYQVNILSIIINLFFVPLVTIIIFPLSIIILIIPKLEFIYDILITLLENLSLFLNDINIGCLIFGKVSIVFYLIYFLLLILFLKYYNRLLIVLYFLILIFHYQYYNIFDYSYLIMLDVGQGDSIIFHNKRKNILIDTGGITSFKTNKWQIREKSSLVETITIPYLKSKGIRKLDYTILSHGDYDHMGEAINLVNQFEVENVIFNNDEFNILENKLIKILKRKKINYYREVEEININDIIFYFLDTGIYDNENDNSNVIYFSLNNYKFLFMGDAGIKREEDILNKYNLSNIDFFKVGHHGSDTSSSKSFINKLNPKICLISVGENNRYKHPKQSVLDILKDCKIYRTDLNGSIEIAFNSSYKVKTYG